MKLSVYHDKTLIGSLEAAPARLSFCYAPEFLAANPYPISLSLPLQKAPFSAQATERFFDGLLPEEDERRRMARYLHVPAASTSKLLSALAGDCVGNLTILSSDHDFEQLLSQSNYQPLAPTEFQAIIGESPALITQLSAENRLSIPGAQSKIGLYHKPGAPPVDCDGWCVPQGLFASTHIVKPDSRFYPLTSLNEYLCTRLAQAVGIATAEVFLINNQASAQGKGRDQAVLVSERFDRACNESGFVTRICQEDFCQALSYSSRYKYEADGGPGFAEIIAVLRSEPSNPPLDVQRFIQLFLFNYLIGNSDAHAKNYSLQRDTAGRLCLAPAYDLVSTTFYPELSRNLAMGVAGCYDLDQITQKHWQALCEQNQLSWSRLHEIATEIAEGVTDALDNGKITAPIQNFDEEFTALSHHLRTEIQSRKQTLIA